MRRLGALLVCLAMATACCIGTAQGSTAMENRDTADEQADRFAGPGAELVSVAGFEVNTSAASNDRSNPYSAAQSYPDDSFGDGEAMAWVYSYRMDNTTYRVTVAHNGTVLANTTDDDVDEDQHPIEDWSVDSEEAADIVEENNDTWSTEGHGFGIYFLSKENATGDPIWNLGQLTENGFLFARVNASTGEYLGAHTFDFDFGAGFMGGYGGDYGGPYWDGSDGDGPDREPPREQGSFEGTVSATSTVNEHVFRLEHEDHDELAIQLDLDQPATGTVSATLYRDDEQVTAVSASPTDTSNRADVDDPEMGDYRVEIELQGGTSQDYTLYWCAPGPAREDPNPACLEEGEGSRRATAAPLAGLAR